MNYNTKTYQEILILHTLTGSLQLTLVAQLIQTREVIQVQNFSKSLSVFRFNSKILNMLFYLGMISSKEQ